MELIKELLGSLASIPDAYWSAIGASLFTTLGVLITNAHSRKQLKTQLAHDSAEKLLDRKATLRREVYLNAAEEIVNATGYLTTLPNVAAAGEELGLGMRGFLVAMAKIQLVAEEATAAEATKLIQEYGELFLKLTMKVVPIQSIQTDIKICDEHYEQSQSEIKRILAAMTEYNESAGSDPHRFQALERSFDFFSKRSDTLSTEEAALSKRRLALILDFLRFALNELDRIYPQQIKVLVAIRREVGLSADVDGLAMQLEQNRQKLKKVVEEMFQEFESSQHEDE
jgi:hypothetical protein